MFSASLAVKECLSQQFAPSPKDSFQEATTGNSLYGLRNKTQLVKANKHQSYQENGLQLTSVLLKLQASKSV